MRKIMMGEPKLSIQEHQEFGEVAKFVIQELLKYRSTFRSNQREYRAFSVALTGLHVKDIPPQMGIKNLFEIMGDEADELGDNPYGEALALFGKRSRSRNHGAPWDFDMHNELAFLIRDFWSLCSDFRRRYQEGWSMQYRGLTECMESLAVLAREMSQKHQIYRQTIPKKKPVQKRKPQREWTQSQVEDDEDPHNAADKVMERIRNAGMSLLEIHEKSSS